MASPSWDGENQLRPWAAAWRVYCERCSRCEDVLVGVLKRLEQLHSEILDGRCAIEIPFIVYAESVFEISFRAKSVEHRQDISIHTSALHWIMVTHKL